MYIDALHKTAHTTERLKTMLKPQVDPVKLAALMSHNRVGEVMLDAEQYKYWLEQTRSQVFVTAGDQGDDGHVIKFNGRYIAFWFTDVRHSEGYIHMHTAQACDTPFEALEVITEIIKTDHEEEQEEAQRRLWQAADEVA